MRKIINHHIEGVSRESHPGVKDLQNPRLGKPRRGQQIYDTRMGFPRPSLNLVSDSISPEWENIRIYHNKTYFIAFKSTSKFVCFEKIPTWVNPDVTPLNDLWRHKVFTKTSKAVIPEIGKDNFGKTALWIPNN